MLHDKKINRVISDLYKTNSFESHINTNSFSDKPNPFTNQTISFKMTKN